MKLNFCTSPSTDFIGNSDKTEAESDGLILQVILSLNQYLVRTVNAWSRRLS